MVTRFPHTLALALAVASVSALSAQRPATIPEDSRVKTLTVRNADNFMGAPLLRLGTDDRIIINFDIPGDAHEYLRYRIIHCNADWTPSRLLESEYTNGFNEAQITDFAYSSNTYVHYVNYNVAIPNEDIIPLVSGNYIVEIFHEDEPDDVVATASFAVTENMAGVAGEASGKTDRGFFTDWQQVNLDIDLSGCGIRNPYQDLVVTVEQNNRPETLRTVSHPLRVAADHAIFEHDQELIFGASNEYRRFETVRLDYPGLNVDSVRFGGTNWHAYLAMDENRDEKTYIYDSTQHGRFMIDEYNATDPDLGADYVTVHFTLDAPEAIGADVYVDGDLTQHMFDERNRMKYDYNTRLYTLQLPLKQGSYNYQYVVLPKDGLGVADPGPVEGNHHETNNEYLVKVFYRPAGARADRLIGASIIP